MDQSLQIREAVIADLEGIVALLADDELGRTREQFEHPLPDRYLKACQVILADPNNELLVALRGDKLSGVQQITFTPYLTYQSGRMACDDRRC